MRNWPNIETFEEFLNGGGLVEPNDQMPEPYRLAVFRLLNFTQTANTWAVLQNEIGYLKPQGSTES